MIRCTNGTGWGMTISASLPIVVAILLLPSLPAVSAFGSGTAFASLFAPISVRSASARPACSTSSQEDMSKEKESQKKNNEEAKQKRKNDLKEKQEIQKRTRSTKENRSKGRKQVLR